MDFLELQVQYSKRSKMVGVAALAGGVGYCLLHSYDFIVNIAPIFYTPLSVNTCSHNLYVHNLYITIPRITYLYITCTYLFPPYNALIFT